MMRVWLRVMVRVMVRVSVRVRVMVRIGVRDRVRVKGRVGRTLTEIVLQPWTEILVLTPWCHAPKVYMETGTNLEDDTRRGLPS